MVGLRSVQEWSSRRIFARVQASLLRCVRFLLSHVPPLFVLLCAHTFCGVSNFCTVVVAAMAEAKSEIEVDFVGRSCCSSYWNLLLCLRLCHVGIFQVRIWNVLSCVVMWLWLGLFYKLVSFLHLPSACLPQSEVLPTTFSHFFSS